MVSTYILIAADNSTTTLNAMGIQPQFNGVEYDLALGQTPFSKQGHLDGTGEEIVKPFTLSFILEAISEEAASREASRILKVCRSTTFLKRSGREAYLKILGIQSMKLEWPTGKSAVPKFTVIFLPKFALWTRTKASTLTEYEGAEYVLF